VGGSVAKLSEVGALVARLQTEGPNVSQAHDLTSIRNKIESGQYRVDADQLAEDLLGSGWDSDEPRGFEEEG
jgi:anti-sigma28 factor (negative regulator of flagellin synthesis)